MENINQIRAEGNNPAPERERLARINELLKVYDELIEGNYIDNLIRAEREHKEAIKRAEERTAPKATQTLNRKKHR